MRALRSWLRGLHGNFAHNQANDIRHLSQLACPYCAEIRLLNALRHRCTPRSWALLAQSDRRGSSGELTSGADR